MKVSRHAIETLSQTFKQGVLVVRDTEAMVAYALASKNAGKALMGVIEELSRGSYRNTLLEQLNTPSDTIRVSIETYEHIRWTKCGVLWMCIETLEQEGYKVIGPHKPKYTLELELTEHAEVVLKLGRNVVDSVGYFYKYEEALEYRNRTSIREALEQVYAHEW